MEIGSNLFAALQNTKLKQDERYRREITKLHHKKELSLKKVKKMRKYLNDMNKKINQWKKKYGKILSLDCFVSKPKSENNILGDLEKTLAQVSCNKTIK